MISIIISLSKEINMGQRGITFEDVRIPKENMSGKKVEVFKIDMNTFESCKFLSYIETSKDN